jgi:hypothetical protein
MRIVAFAIVPMNGRYISIFSIDAAEALCRTLSVFPDASFLPSSACTALLGGLNFEMNASHTPEIIKELYSELYGPTIES